MPFAEVAGAVTGALHRPGQVLELRIERLGHAHALVVAGRHPVVDTHFCGETSGEHGGAGRRAEGGVHVKLLEEHALLSHAVEAGRGDVEVPVATEIPPAEVVDEDEDDVGFPGRGVGRVKRGQRREKEGGNERKDGFHGCCEMEDYWVAESVRKGDAGRPAAL